MFRSSGAPDRALSLLRKWQEEQDVDALDELLQLEVRELARRLRRKGGEMLRPSQSASDVAQEAVTRLLGQLAPPQFDDPLQLRAYLWKAAWRLLLNRAHSASRRVVRFSATDSGGFARALATTGGLGALERREQSLALDLALELMRPDDRRILELVYLKGTSIEAAAAELGVSRDAADMRLTRARRRLAEKLVAWSDCID